MNADEEYKAFVDTNILIYSIDRSMGKKHKRAQELLLLLAQQNLLVLSTQSAREFSNVFIKKFGSSHTTQLLNLLDSSLEPYIAIRDTPQMIRSSILLSVEHGLSFYDALILQSAIDAGCDVLYSEDFQHGRVYSGVQIINPFLAKDL